MEITAKSAVVDALRLMGHVNAMGTVDENREARFFGAATVYLNILCREIARAEGAQDAPSLTGLNEELPVSNDSAKRVLPFGLAMYFSVMDRDGELYNFFSSMYYGTLLPSVQAPETTLTDYYGVLKDSGFRA